KAHINVLYNFIGLYPVLRNYNYKKIERLDFLSVVEARHYTLVIVKMAPMFPSIERIDCGGRDSGGRRDACWSWLLGSDVVVVHIVAGSLRESCRAPLPPAAHRRSAAPIKKTKNKPRSKQPKKVKFITTEIRCQEKSKGGLAYEVILAEPVNVTPPKRPSSPSSKVSAENIEEKLKAAEERRLSLEANKMAVLAAKMSKIEEASKKKDEQANTFISQTREALEQKMETHIEKREAYINDLKSKLKDHLESVEKTRLSLEQQTNEVRNAVEEKLKTASAQRDENIKKMLDRLREHVDCTADIIKAIKPDNYELTHREQSSFLGMHLRLRPANNTLNSLVDSIKFLFSVYTENMIEDSHNKLFKIGVCSTIWYPTSNVDSERSISQHGVVVNFDYKS
ncbi:hypothetical protein L9F63_017425, partial [Diploptera punctata]